MNLNFDFCGNLLLKIFLKKCFLFDDVFQSFLAVFHRKAKFAIYYTVPEMARKPTMLGSWSCFKMLAFKVSLSLIPDRAFLFTFFTAQGGYCAFVAQPASTSLANGGRKLAHALGRFQNAQIQLEFDNQTLLSVFFSVVCCQISKIRRFHWSMLSMLHGIILRGAAILDLECSGSNIIKLQVLYVSTRIQSKLRSARIV